MLKWKDSQTVEKQTLIIIGEKNVQTSNRKKSSGGNHLRPFLLLNIENEKVSDHLLLQVFVF